MDTNIHVEHLHQETKTLPILDHLELHASQLQRQDQHPSHPIIRPNPSDRISQKKETNNSLQLE